MGIKKTIKSLPVVGGLLQRLYSQWLKITAPFHGSQDYWDSRYRAGGHSGDGSRGPLAEFKADTLNAFVAEKRVKSVIEWGCGDGGQLTMAVYPEYLGFDVSAAAVERCRDLFRDDDTKSFALVEDYDGQTASLSMSLDVIYHLVEDQVFDDYMQKLFVSASEFVIVYSSNTDEQAPGQGAHVLHRKFTAWIDTHQPDWRQISVVRNEHPYAGDSETGSFADFYVFQKA